MTDSVAVFPAGFRLTDSTTGDPMSGATIEFYDAGTSTPKTVYADEGLSTSLGTSVTCDSLGYPTSDGTTKTLIYVGTAAYKIVIKTSGGTTIATHDNVKGAVATVDTSNLNVVFVTPVEVKSLDYTVLSTDQSKRFVSNCSGGDVTFTLPSAVTVGDGWFIHIAHAGSANQTLIATVSSQTISDGATSYSTVMALAYSGESLTLISDGGNWRVDCHTVPHIKGGQGVLQIADRLSSPPGSPANGALYILTSSPSGAWSSFSEHDVVQYTSSAWVRFTPREGWIAWVADEDVIYVHTGSAWQTLAVTYAASQAEQEAGSSIVKFVSPGVQQFHPSAAKFWAVIDVSGGEAGTPTLTTSYNVTSITDTATGQLTVTVATDFSSVNWACLATCELASSGTLTAMVNTIAAGSVLINARNLLATVTDPDAWHIVGFGDQA